MEGKMKAAVLHGINDLRIEEVEIPRLDEHDVLVRVSACGVCGSDLPRILTQGTYHFPTIPGHEFGGEVVAIGSCVKQNLLHKNVAVIPLIPCRTCKSCEVGDFAQCENYDFLGSRSDGGFAEYVKVPEENLVIMPDQVKPETAAFLEPISVALHVVSNTGVNFGDDVVVFGLGAIGNICSTVGKGIWGISCICRRSGSEKGGDSQTAWLNGCRLRFDRGSTRNRGKSYQPRRL